MHFARTPAIARRDRQHGLLLVHRDEDARHRQPGTGTVGPQLNPCFLRPRDLDDDRDLPALMLSPESAWWRRFASVSSTVRSPTVPQPARRRSTQALTRPFCLREDRRGKRAFRIDVIVPGSQSRRRAGGSGAGDRDAARARRRGDRRGEGVSAGAVGRSRSRGTPPRAPKTLACFGVRGVRGLVRGALKVQHSGRYRTLRTARISYAPVGPYWPRGGDQRAIENGAMSS